MITLYLFHVSFIFSSFKFLENTKRKKKKGKCLSPHELYSSAEETQLLTEQSVSTSHSQHPWIECEGSKFLVENVRLEVKRTWVCPLEEVPPFNQSFLTINKANIWV